MTLSIAYFCQNLHFLDCYESWGARQSESAKIKKVAVSSQLVCEKLLQAGFIARSPLHLYQLGQRGDKKTRISLKHRNQKPASLAAALAPESSPVTGLPDAGSSPDDAGAT